MSGPELLRPWAFDEEENHITFKGAPVFAVFREWEFPCLEDEDRASADAEFLSHAAAAVALLNGASASAPAAHNCPKCDDAMECDCEPPLPMFGSADASPVTIASPVLRAAFDRPGADL